VTDSPKPLDGGPEFESLLGKLAQVPKREVDQRLRRAKKRKAKRRKPKQ